MENNTNKTFWIWVIVIAAVVLIAAGFYASYRASHSAGNNGGTSNNQSTQTSANQTPSQPEQTINVRHQYANGVQTYAGQVDVPTPCDMISSQVVANPNDPTSFTLAFTTVVSTTTPANECAQVITSRNFELNFTAPANVTVNATLDGQPAILNVFEVPVGQNVNSAIYLKG